MAYDITLVVVGPNLSKSSDLVVFPKPVSPVFSDIAVSATAGDELHPILACLVSPKMHIYLTIVHTPLLSLVGPQVLISAS